MNLTNIIAVMNNAIYLNQKCIVISHVRRIYPVGIYNDPYIRRYISIIVYEKCIVCRSSARRSSPVGIVVDVIAVDDIAIRVNKVRDDGFNRSRRSSPVGNTDIDGVEDYTFRDDTTSISIVVLRARRFLRP